jgi:signal transduction histidine kinase
MTPGKLILLTLLLVWPAIGFGSQAISIPVDFQALEIGTAIDFLEDADRTLGFEEIVSNDKLPWQSSQAPVPNFGFTQSAYWLRFTLESDPDKARSLYLQIAYPALDKIELYINQADGSHIRHISGDHYPFAERELQNRNFIFKIDHQGRRTYYLRCETSGSLKIPLKLFDPEYFQSVDEKEVTGLGIFCGIMLAMILYNSFLAVTIRDLNYVYYICYISLFMMFNLSLSGLTFQYLWPQNIWLANFSIPMAIYGSSFFALTFSRRFLGTRQHAPYSDKAILFLMGWGFLGILLIAVVPYKITTQLSTALALMVNVVLLTAGIDLVRKGHRSARFYLIAFAAIWCGMAVKAIQTLGFLPVTPFTENGVVVGSMAEVILLSLALGDKIQREQKAAKDKIESLNADLSETVRTLDKKVAEQTSDIRSMLQYIRQGIFTVEMIDNIPVLSTDFSEHLIHILGTRDIAGKPLMDVVFGRANVSEDARSQIQSVMHSCLGESVIAYELNSEQLPQEFTLSDPDGSSRIIEIEWCPVLSKDGSLVQKFLVTLRDVSSYRILQAQSREQQDELLLISELINTTNASFLRFCQLCQDIFQENHRLAAAGATLDVSSLKMMFINMHTLKGAARQLGLGRLTSQIHTVEQTLANLARNPQQAHDTKSLTALIASCEQTLQQYVHMNHQKLGRTLVADDIPVSRKLLEKLVRCIRELPPPPLSQANLKGLREFSEKLTSSLYQSSEVVLREILKHADTLARDLHKANPIIRIESAPVILTSRGEELLRKVFLHLIRNSLDHGIEVPEERIAKGKPAQGIITVVVEQADARNLRIRYQDDGKGINVERLRTMAKDLGLLSETALADPIQVAQVIFENGVSTSKSITHISGRGVGMGAIKEYIERWGGHIELRILSTDERDVTFLPFELILFTPLEKMVAWHGDEDHGPEKQDVA